MTEEVKAQLKMVDAMIERYINTVGLKRENTYNTADNMWYWRRGSAQIEAGLIGGGNNRYYLCVYSFLMEVPPQKTLEAYKHLLELNFDKLGVKISIKPNTSQVFAIAERDINGIDYEELATYISDLEWWADKLDDELKNTFGAF
ncbi:MAG: hypothetical protein EAZ55_02555 [Cytophagales bacterium]|nr:MAG: hypothetical protein EAZ55_02555 [Cytophagales bacterium]